MIDLSQRQSDVLEFVVQAIESAAFRRAIARSAMHSALRQQTVCPTT